MEGKPCTATGMVVKKKPLFDSSVLLTLAKVVVACASNHRSASPLGEVCSLSLSLLCMGCFWIAADSLVDVMRDTRGSDSFDDEPNCC